MSGSASMPATIMPQTFGLVSRTSASLSPSPQETFPPYPKPDCQRVTLRVMVWSGVATKVALGSQPRCSWR